jgi:hypothetical protein
LVIDPHRARYHAAMIPDLASVMRKRYRMERTIRFSSLVLLVIWFVWILAEVFDGLAGVIGGEVNILSRMIRDLLLSAPYLIAAAVLAGMSGRLARWILPIPRTGCPRCGHRIVALTEPRCPECGLSIPRELMADPDPSGSRT